MNALDPSREQHRRALESLTEACDERERYRDALTRIATAESGWWGQIARAALYPDRKAA